MNIGLIKLPDKTLALAPMEEVSDIPFRLICKRLGADLLYTEFISSEALIRNARKAVNKINLHDEERPIGIQIYGGIESSMEGAIKIVEKANPDFIDINCGCWARKISMRGWGAGLLRDLSKFESIVKASLKVTNLPVTVKTRLGWDEENIVIIEVAKMLEQLGVKALTVHCRTRSQGQKGPADWSWLEKLKRSVSIPIIGNGDVFTPLDAKRMFETGCDGVMIGRGAIANPFTFRQTKHYFQTGDLEPTVSLQEKIETCIEHLKLSVQYKGSWKGVYSFRKHFAGYLRGLPHIAKLRSELVQFKEADQIIERLIKFAEQNCHLEIIPHKIYREENL